MASIQEIRAQYPQYDDMSDGDLAKALHGKYYSDMPYEEFSEKIGLAVQAPIDARPRPQEKSVGGFVQNIGSDAYNTGAAIARGIYTGGRKLVTDPVGAGKDVANAVDTAGAVISGGLGHAYNDFVSAPMLSVSGHEVIPGIGKEYAMTPGADMNLASNVGGYLKDRYWDNLGDTLYEHPVQSAMDISSLAYGGQAALPRAMVGTRKALGTVAEATNPLNVVAKPVQKIREIDAERRAMKQMRKDAPTLDDVVTRKNALYGELDNAGIKFDANAYGQMLNSLSNKLSTFRATRAPMTADTVKYMMTKNGTSPSFRDVEEMLIEAKGILREHSATNADKAAAHILLNEVDTFFNKAPVMSNGRIAPDQISAVAKEARELARRHIIAREVGEIERKSKWYTSGDESGKRNQVSSFGKRSEKSLSELEKKAAQKVVRREGLHGLLTTGGSRLVQAMLAGGLGISAGTAGLGIPAALATTAVAGGLNLGARAASSAMTNRKLDQLRKTVLAGRDAQNAAMAKAKRLPVKTKGLLLGGQSVGLLSGRQ